MAFDNLYRVKSLDGSLFYVISVRATALVVALDIDTRDQSEVEADLPNDGDFPIYDIPTGEPRGALKATRDNIEKALVRAISEGRLEPTVVARDINDRIDTAHTLIGLSDVETWATERDVSLGEWWMRYGENEMEAMDEFITDIANYRIPANESPREDDGTVLEAYRQSDEDEQERQFQRLLLENRSLRDSAAKKPLTHEKEVGTKERTSLYIIIAALIEKVGDGFPESHYKRAQMIQSIADGMGVSIAVNTADTVFKQLPAVIEPRRKSNL
jgi:hypothetical protein